MHLYCDPTTSEGGKYPIFYADCEGLSGGNREPIGAKSRRERADSSQKRSPSFQRKLRKFHHAKRPVKWATTTHLRSREYAVENLYPRLLFTFSDTIVFVEKNPRTIEHTIELLVTWAASSFERTSNQPVLPHLIIAFNASSDVLESEHWDVDAVTRKVLEKDLTLEALQRNPVLAPKLDFWKHRGKIIDSPRTLLLSYYHDVRIVRIPTDARPKTVHDQVGKLYEEIRKSCDSSRARKTKARMLLDAEEIQVRQETATFTGCTDHMLYSLIFNMPSITSVSREALR